MAQHATERSAVSVHREMGRGLGGLATVAATAPFLGMLGTALGIIGSFVGGSGEKTAMMAALAGRLSESIMPTAFGLALGIVATCGYQYLTARLAEFDAEIRCAILQLPGYLRLP